MGSSFYLLSSVGQCAGARMHVRMPKLEAGLKVTLK
jgi:hypothetical protein